MAKTKTPAFEVGQTLYVSITGWYPSKNEPKLHEYIVTRFNKTSVYAKPKEFPDHHETRFTIRTMTASNGFGDTYRAYTNPDQYWDIINRIQERKDINSEITPIIEHMTLEQLRDLRDFIKNKL